MRRVDPTATLTSGQSLALRQMSQDELHLVTRSFV